MEVLAADIGGTNARLAVVKGRHIIFKEVYKCDDFPGPIELLSKFKQDFSGTFPSLGCLAVAGRVESNRVSMLNRDWLLDGDELASFLKMDALFLANDFQAAAMGVCLLKDKDLVKIGSGSPVPHTPIAVLGPGTGLGEALLVPYAGGYEVLPTEGGHGDFAPVDEFQVGLLKFLQKQFDHVSIERVVSGPGLLRIFEYILWHTGKELPDFLLEYKENLSPKLISDAAISDKDDICKESLNMFCRILGQEAGNMALRSLATGGVYLAGGICPQIIPFLQKRGFRASFEDKGRMKSFLEEIPIYIITNPNLGLIGAGLIARKKISRHKAG